MDELLTRSATEAARAVRDGLTSSHELVEAQLARIDRLNPALNALVEVHREDALARAVQADRAVRAGEQLGPLHGVPISIKEAFQVEGFHSTWGVPDNADFTAGRDAAVVARLKAAGAIVVATSNVAAMLADFAQSDNPVYGQTHNPWDPARVPGGSTGGGAAAVAAGLSFLDYGSDLSGSVRLPAALCGVYGLRASAALVPVRGFQPPGPPAPPNERAGQIAFGPLARSAADLRSALAVTAGPDALSAPFQRWPLVPPRHRRLRDFRVGLVLDHPAAPVTGEVGAVLSDAVDALSRVGATVSEGWPPGYDPQRGAEAFGMQLQWYFALVGEDSQLSLDQVLEAERRRLAARQAWQAFFEDHDVFLSPTSFTTAFPHDDRPSEKRRIPTAEGERPYLSLPFWTLPSALCGLPALSAPAGLSRQGLPVGLQVTGPLWEDDTAISFAELLAEVIGGYQAPPDLLGA